MEIGLELAELFNRWDDRPRFLLNETAVRYLGWGAPADAIGKRFEWIPFGGKKGDVIGVVEDFHLRTIHEEIEPVVILTSSYQGYVLIRVAPDGIPETVSRIEEVWRDVDPRYPLEYTFLEEDFDRLYRADRQLGEVFASFAFLAVFVACLGLLGLSSFSIQQRTKEIGIRKVLGSTVSGIVVLLSRDFMKYVLLANVIAWPLAYYAMTIWLQNYAYSSEIRLAWRFRCFGRNPVGNEFLPESSGLRHVRHHVLTPWCINQARAREPVSELRSRRRGGDTFGDLWARKRRPVGRGRLHRT